MEGDTVPVIDISSFCDDRADAEAQNRVVEEVHRAVKEIGFMYIKGIALPDVEVLQEVNNIFELSHELFASELEEKLSVAWEKDLNIGYVAVERERLDPTKKGDLKEAFNVGNPKASGTFWERLEKRIQDERNDISAFKDRWHHTRTTLAAFFQMCQRITRIIMRIFALALELDTPEFFDALLSEQAHTLRLLHYPPLDKEVAEAASSSGDQTRAGEHSDYGCITLLWQDDVGGLEVKNTKDQWIDAPCIENAVLVNTGDLIQRWTNNSFKSTRHRVGIPKDEEKRKRHRYSVAFFAHPNDDTPIIPFASCVSASRPAAYPPISALDYLNEKLGKSY